MPADEHGHATPAGEEFTIGARVQASDGECGTLARIVIDPVAQAVTHLVVAPHGHAGIGKLVPLALVTASDGARIELSCSVARFHELDDADDIHFTSTGSASDSVSNILRWPHFGAAIGLGGAHLHVEGSFETDRIPVGEVEVRRGDQVHASDGWIGVVEGLVIDPADHHVTHVLLQEGHPWGRKQVAIPIGATSHVGDVIRVGLTMAEIEALPPVELSSG
jgi:sporulation protein YlmC with PRC-barrel domain